MYKSTHKIEVYLIGMFLFLQLQLLADITVFTNKSTAYYSAGETMQFNISSDDPADINYWIIYNEFSDTLTQGTISNHVPGTLSKIEFTLDHPGFVLCVVEQSFQEDIAGAAFSPHDIQPTLPRPNDFLEFWENEIEQSNNIPLDPIITYIAEDEYTETFSISLAHIDDRRIYGFITLPKGEGPFPASLMLPPFGGSANVVQADRFTAERAGMIAVAISIHNTPPDQADPNAYEPNDPTNRNNIYYRYAIIAGIRMIDYLNTRDDFDGENICVIGNSQGGGLSLLVGGIDERVNLMLQSIPTMCGHSEYKFGKPCGFPYYLYFSDITNGTAAHFEQTLSATNYYDGIYAAQNFKGASMNFVSYEDLTTPPSTGFAAFNQLPGPKIMWHSPLSEHGNPSEWSNDRYEFFRRHFEATQDPPWPFTDETNGYYIDAGSNFEIVSNESKVLNAVYDKNGVTENNWEVKWDLVIGPGNVQFSDDNSIQSSVTFDEPGNYKLRLIVTDPYATDDEIFVQLVDYLDVTVLEDLSSNTNQQNLRSPFIISPNPTQLYLNIKMAWDQFESSKISIFNTLGEKVYEITYQGQKINSNVDIGNLPSGKYYIEIDNGKQKVKDKFVISR